MTRQKLTSLLLAGTMLVPLTGCGNSTPAETQPEIVETEPAETEYVPTIAETLAEKYADTDYVGYTFRIMNHAPGQFFYY